MGRNNKDFVEGKDHRITWQGADGNTYSQVHPTSQLLPEVDKQKAVGKYMGAVFGKGDTKPVKGSVKWEAVD